MTEATRADIVQCENNGDMKVFVSPQQVHVPNAAINARVVASEVLKAGRGKHYALYIVNHTGHWKTLDSDVPGKHIEERLIETVNCIRHMLGV